MKQLRIEDIDLEGIRAVVFDLDGTLYDKRFLPLRLVAGDLHHALWIASERHARRLLKGQDFGDADTFYKTLFTHISSHQNVPYLKVKEWYFGQYLPLTIDILYQHYEAGAFVIPLLRELDKRNIKTAVFSDYRCVEDKIRAIGLESKMFDYCLAAPELGGLKPNKTLFMRLLKLMRVKPEQTLMIGDREDTDGQGTKNAGMKFLKV